MDIKINKEILRLALPNILSNISVPLLSTVDTMLMGKFSELHLGAVGLGAMLFNFIYWNFGFLRMGTTGITAQALGQQNDQEIMATLGRALSIALFLAILILIFHVPLLQLGNQLLNVSANQEPLVNTYFNTRIWAAPATLGLYALMGWFFGMQNAIFPLILTLVVNVVNIVGNFVFVYYFKMEVDGIALATVIAQYTGLILGLILWKRRYGYLLGQLTYQAVIEFDKLKAFLVINRDIFIRTLSLTFAFGFFYSQSSAGGETILAVNVILLQFVNWMSYAVDGFAFASESLVGKYKGANNLHGLRHSIRYSFGWGMGMAVLFSLAYVIFSEELVALFTNQTQLIEATRPFLLWIILFPIISTPCYIWDGVFIGITASKAMRNTMLLALAAYLIIHYWLFPIYGNHGLWGAFLIFMLLRGLFMWAVWSRWHNLEPG
ncbi:MAG: MATE family multidrug resistance protein [Saprospiraceae bacterium]